MKIVLNPTPAEWELMVGYGRLEDGYHGYFLKRYDYGSLTKTHYLTDNMFVAKSRLRQLGHADIAKSMGVNYGT